MPWVDLPECAYYALVSRADQRPKADVWSVGLRDRLPHFVVPVKAGEAEPSIDLQSILHRVYDASGYASSIYDGLPEPLLKPPDAAWAEELLSAPTA